MELGLLGEMPDSLSGAGNEQDEPGTSCHARQQGSSQRLLGSIERTQDPT